MKTIKQFLKSIQENKLIESKQQFQSILNDKIQIKLDEAKIAVAKSFYENKDQDQDDEPCCDGDDHKTIHTNLKSMADLDSDQEYTHANGEKSNIHSKDIQKILDMIEHGSVKPEVRQNVLQHLHGSKEGLNKFKDLANKLDLSQFDQDSRVKKYD